MPFVNEAHDVDPCHAGELRVLQRRHHHVARDVHVARLGRHEVQVRTRAVFLASRGAQLTKVYFVVSSNSKSRNVGGRTPEQSAIVLEVRCTLTNIQVR